MGILSTNKKIINLGQGYSAGNGISIDDYVISYTGNEGQLYNAGPNIDIYDDQGQLYISGKDWSADIANASSNAYEQATALIPPEFDPSYISGVVDNKLDTTAFSTVSGDYATTSYVDMSDDLTYSRATAWGNQNLAPLNSVADNSAKWNEIEVYEQNSATYLTAHQDISNKLDTTAFSTVSGTFLTAHQVIPSAKWENASDVVQSNSAQWSENTGDEEVNNAVYNNSAKWNDISVYQTNSANYLTAHQDISNKLDTTAFSTVSGTFLTAHQDLSNYATTGDLNTASGILSGAVDYVSAHAGDIALPITGSSNSTTATYDSNSAMFDYSETQGEPTHNKISVSPGEGIIEIYNSSDEDETNSTLTLGDSYIQFKDAEDNYNMIMGYNIETWDNTYNTVQSNSANWSSTTYTGDAQGALDEVYANSGVWLTAHQVIPSAKWEEASTEYEQNSATYLTAHQDISNKLDTTAFSTVSGSFLTAVDLTPYYTTADANTLSSMLSGAIDYVSANAGDEFPASANEAITAYQNASGTYLTAHQPISANEWNDVYETVETNSGSWAGGGTSLTGDAQGAVDEVYSNSADWNSNYSTVNANSGTWTNGGFTGEVYGISGVSPNVDVYIDQNTLWISAAAGGAGNPEVESYVQTNSASIDDAVSTYETSSGTYLTAHQDISNKLDTTAFSTVSGTFLTAHQDISANEWNSVYDTVETNSGSWTGGGTTYTGDAQGALDTIYSISGNIISGSLNSYKFTANNITSMKLSNITIGYNIISADVPGYPARGWKLSQNTLFFGPAWSYTTNENYQRTMLDNTGLSAMSGLSNDKKLIWKAILDTDISGTNNTITSINGSAIGGGASYTAGSGIDITNDTISVTGYSLSGAGSVSIIDDDNVIIISGGAPTGDFATTGDLNTVSSILSGAVDYVSANAGASYSGIYPIVVDNTTYQIGADVEEISALDVEFGTGLGFTNGVLSVSGYATQSDIDYLSGAIGDVETLLASL